MKTRDLTELAIRNLREAILRNSLTTLGVAVGVASLVAMLSLGVGLQTLASKRLLRSGLFDSVLVSSGRENRGPGRPPRQRCKRLQNSRTSPKSIRRSAFPRKFVTLGTSSRPTLSAFLNPRAKGNPSTV
jgi:hypothetical protein